MECLKCPVTDLGPKKRGIYEIKCLKCGFKWLHTVKRRGPKSKAKK